MIYNCDSEIMDKSHSVKLHHLDLAKRGADLEDIFESVIRRLPDLCMPPSYRFAGEDDFFNRTKSIKLVPFRKQSNFAKCKSPEPEDRATASALLDSDLRKIERKKSRRTPDRQLLEGNDHRAGYEKLFKKVPPDKYPFANPIAECMLADSNIDNLGEIVVSSLDIEWKMLTPFRLNNEYEEKYFDRLFQLHRNRYRTRLELGYFANNQRTPFKHTRHAYLVQYGSHRRCHSPVALSRSDLLESGGTGSGSSGIVKLTIPTLTLTSDERSSKPISGGSSDGSDGEELDDYDYQEYSYENFSRYSRDNLRQTSDDRKQSLSSNDEEAGGLEMNLSIRQQNMANYDDALEDQVENIISHLISADNRDMVA